jgi:hypothetical protein
LGAGLDRCESQTEETSLTVGPGRYDDNVGSMGATTFDAVDVACNVAPCNNVVEHDKSNVDREEKTREGKNESRSGYLGHH